MALTDQIVWTVLPQGYVDAGTIRIGVLVSPRLGFTAPIPPASDRVVGQFEHWVDWPKTLANSKITLVIDGVAGPTITPNAHADSDVWHTMVPKATPVDTFKFTDLRDKVVLSYPVALLAATIEATYAKLGAVAGEVLPTKSQLLPAVRKLVAEPRDKRSVMRALHDPQGLSALHSSPQGGMDLLALYHTSLNTAFQDSFTPPAGSAREPVKWQSHTRPPRPSAKQLVDSIDFHKIAAAAIQHSDMARWMGLVLEFDLPAAVIPDGVGRKLSLQVNRGGHTPADIYPVTVVNKKSPTFEAAPRNPASSPLIGRFLNLKAKGMDLVQMDVDGAGLKLRGFAESAANLKTSAYSDEVFGDQPEGRAGTPSLRTAGLMLAQARRDLTAKDAFNTSGALQDGTAPGKTMPPLYAEDLVRGFRIDVKDQSGDNTWRSLMQRVVDFTFLNGGAARTGQREEGMVRMTAGSSADGANPDVVKVHEGLFVWRGWSLVAPEPFKALARDGESDTPVPPVQDNQGDAPPPGLPLKVNFTAQKGSLPKLRFGRRYVVRARVVDLTGASPAASVADQPEAALSTTIVYRRYEPLEPPALVLPVGEKPAEGESMNRAAIRTFNSHPDGTEADNIPVNHDQVGRIVAAPRVSVRFAEPHGVLDAGGRMNPALFDMLKKQDNPFRTEPPLATPPNPPNYAVADVGAPLPYLPDPMALGVAIRIGGLDNVNPDTVFKFPFYGAGFDPAALPKWPEAQTFVIVGSEGITMPEIRISGSERVFAVPLRKGERAILRLSGLIAPQLIGNMALREPILEAAGSNAAALSTAMLDGQHWMLTPWTTLELVHAVQKPLRTPDLATLKAERSGAGELDAQIYFRTPLSAHSTAKIDLQARWNEPNDDPLTDAAKTAPSVVPHRQHVFDKHIARSDAPKGEYSLRDALHAFQDTRYRRVTYTLDATTRYREFMPAAIAANPDALKVTSPDQIGWIRNTAPPPPPKILYVIPTFGWSRGGSGGQKVSLRSGGGLRVYLDRPWFSTGFGEMLAVVLPGPEVSNTDADGSMKTLITQWGRDPIWTSSGINTLAPSRSAFPLAKYSGPIGFDASGAAVAPPAMVQTFRDEHAGLPSGNYKVAALRAPSTPSDKTLEVAPHAVGYDTDRQLWYCDIVIRPPSQSYYPFVRLALARYQPVSAEDCYLSAVVTTEFHQLSPDRAAIVNQTGNGAKASIAVYGFAPADIVPGAAGAAIFRAKTQVLKSGGDADLDWTDATGTSVAATPTAGIGNTALVAGATSSTRLGAQFQLSNATQQAFTTNNISSLPGLGLGDLLAPALLWTWEGNLPPIPAGGKRRVLITESESYVNSDLHTATNNNLTSRGERIVYAEAVEI